jgi:hypothetical protein
VAPVPTPLTWKRRSFAVLEASWLDRHQRSAVAVSGLVAGPFAIYRIPDRTTFHLIHLPTQAKLTDQEMLLSCKDAAERFAALDLNWWTCTPEEVIGPDLQAMRNLFVELSPRTWVSSASDAKEVDSL